MININIKTNIKVYAKYFLGKPLVLNSCVFSNKNDCKKDSEVTVVIIKTGIKIMFCGNIAKINISIPKILNFSISKATVKPITKPLKAIILIAKGAVIIRAPNIQFNDSN